MDTSWWSIIAKECVLMGSHGVGGTGGRGSPKQRHKGGEGANKRLIFLVNTKVVAACGG